ncbi:hypothetical protein BU15DRAFT_76481 [Melanogaster broomeanus]|nr:hypothetical protein BU15DRAFT_76481 [Melanogaster broomeanus]
MVPRCSLSANDVGLSGLSLSNPPPLPLCFARSAFTSQSQSRSRSGTEVLSLLLDSHDMDMLATTKAHSGDNGDALEALARVADAFDHPATRQPHKDSHLVVNVIKAHRPYTNCSSEESQCQHAIFPQCDSSFDVSYDNNELMRLTRATLEGQAGLYASEKMATRHYCCHEEARSLSEMTFQQDNAFHDITKMLIADSPLDRLNYLARVELKKTGWLERADQWAIVNLGFSDLSLPVTPPKIIAESVLPTTPVVVFSGLHTESYSSPPPPPSQLPYPTSLRNGQRESSPQLWFPESHDTALICTPSSKHHDHAYTDEDKIEVKAGAQGRPHTLPHDSYWESSFDDLSTVSYATTSTLASHASSHMRAYRPPRTHPHTYPEEQRRSRTRARRA